MSQNDIQMEFKWKQSHYKLSKYILFKVINPITKKKKPERARGTADGDSRPTVFPSVRGPRDIVQYYRQNFGYLFI